MKGSTIVLISCVFTLQIIASSSTKIVPASIWDQAKAQLEELKARVDTSAKAGKVDLDRLRTNHQSLSDEAETQTLSKLDDEFVRIAGLINDLQTLADTANVKIDNCLLSQPQLTTLLTDCQRNEHDCLNGTSTQVDRDIETGNKDIDQNVQFVADIETELNACSGGSIACVSPVLRDIEAAKTEIPEAIERAVRNVRSLVDVLDGTIDQCSDVTVSDFMTESDTIFRQIETCVDNLL